MRQKWKNATLLDWHSVGSAVHAASQEMPRHGVVDTRQVCQNIHQKCHLQVLKTKYNNAKFWDWFALAGCRVYLLDKIAEMLFRFQNQLARKIAILCQRHCLREGAAQASQVKFAVFMQFAVLAQAAVAAT